MRLSQDEMILAVRMEDALEPYYMQTETSGFGMAFRRHMSCYGRHLIANHTELETHVRKYEYAAAVPFLIELGETLATLEYTLPVFGLDNQMIDGITSELYTLFIDGSVAVTTLNDYIQIPETEKDTP